VLDLCQVRLRANPRFQLVPYDRLSTSERDALQSLTRDRDFFGILIPPSDSDLPRKSVTHDAALLFLALSEPSCLPSLLIRLLGPQVNERLRQLVLDQVLEAECAGQFVSGPAALTLLGEQPDPRANSRVARLSSEAIDYAQALESLRVSEVAVRLYRFNSAPSTPALQKQFASDDRVDAFVGADASVRRCLQSTWGSAAIEDGWSVWSKSSIASLEYKLYVSPSLQDLPRVFAVAVQAFAQVDCPRFKLGRTAYGLLRPDKLVAYFRGLEALHRAAELIAERAAEAAPQGVPFSAPIDATGLLSWGMDPPRFERVLKDQADLSWRQWLSERVAVYAIAARQSGGDAQAFVRQRIALDGVDPVDWTPVLGIWRAQTATHQGDT
jgi:hypothetical protein